MIKLNIEALEYAEKGLRMRHKVFDPDVEDGCEYKNHIGKRFCNATTQEACCGCRFYSPTLKAKKEFLKQSKKWGTKNA